MEKAISDYELIKKYYGEEFAKLCRELFPTILEYPNKLFNIIFDHFAPNHYLYKDIILNNKKNIFKEYIYQLLDEDKQYVTTNKSVRELLSLAGYDFYECHTEAEINKFKKYYAEGERLCTFNGGRLNTCYVFFAVKKDVDKIKREDFLKPERQDEYGTSVISIQFSLGSINTLSIKNRYNHTVSNPDATFSNNLENIIPGLSDAFTKEYNLNIDQYEENTFEIPNYVKARDGKLYKYNYEINGIYYCPNNTTIFNGKVHHLDKSKYLLIDYFLINMHDKTIETYDEMSDDCFPEDITYYNKLEIINNKQNKTKKISITIPHAAPITIIVDEFNRIIEYHNNNITDTETEFLRYNKTLKCIELNNIKNIGTHFLSSNNSLKEISLPNVQTIDNSFLEDNKILSNIYLPKVKYIGSYFLVNNRTLTRISLDKVERIGNLFLTYNSTLRTVHLPALKEVGDSFLHNNSSIKEIKLPSLEIIGNKFLNCNTNLKYIYLPNVKSVGDYFLYNNQKLKMFFAPNLETIGNYFLFNNEILTKLSIKRVKNIKDGFMFYNKKLWASFPNLKEVGRDFLFCNEILYQPEFTKLRKLSNNFLPCNHNLKWSDLPLILRYKVLYNRLKEAKDNYILDIGQTLNR